MQFLLPTVAALLLGFGPAPDDGVATFAKENGYRAVPCEKGNVWLFLPWGDADTAARKTKLVEQTLEAVERFLPPAAANAPSPPLHVLQLRNLDDCRSLRELLASRHVAFDTTGESELVGFVTADPFVGVWAEKVPGQEEWDPDNELVNRLAQLAIQRRVGRLPYWLEMGIAWNVEQQVRGSIYCFPYRAGFVWASEHRGWHTHVKKWMATRKMKAVDLDVLTAWKRGTFELDPARFAWDVVRALAEGHPDEFPRALSTLAELRAKKEWKKNPDGSEQTIAGFELSASDQLAVLRSVFGEGVLEETADWLRKQK